MGDERLASEPIELEVVLASGATLAKLDASPSWRIHDLMFRLTRFLEPGTCVQSLHIPAGEMLEFQSSLRQFAGYGCLMFQAVLGHTPRVHVFDLDRLFGKSVPFRWRACPQYFHPCSMGDAPLVGREIANALVQAFPDLEHSKVCCDSRGTDGGEVVVISNPGPDPEHACFCALGLHTLSDWSGARSKVTLEWQDWKANVAQGLSFNDVEEAEGTPESISFRAMTTIMVEQLRQHFAFGFCEDITVAPVIYGGYASDGTIVGILTSRVYMY